MAKYCSRCNKQLTFRDSFVWENQPICKSCLNGLEQGQKWEEIAEPAPKQVRKSIVIAVLLAVFFGPLGMLYVRQFMRALLVALPSFIGWIILSGVSPNSPITIMVTVLYAVTQLIILPVWAGIRAKDLTEEARLSEKN